MKWVTLVLIAAITWFQYSLWISKGGWRDMWRLQDKVAEQGEKNQALTLRNNALQAEVDDLAKGQDAIAEIARVDLGYIQNGETYYRLVYRR
ncbi:MULTISPECIES: cell division protein FtsB [Neisseria]|uniref:Cell division protein FtsB n=1 Tax=Neisseria dentiae TaxID=194197 RepID=A0A1X3D264_9NEIS|nr:MULTISPECIES: cell division protein FtsB [Neisseria]MCQ9325858.1 cell division protein FtsB [Neisseria dentiae]MDO4227808.1 cell division protein FtsB [Neisseria sp.]MDO4907168.1 cell division protein FtsB [Neisseria sp.]OSI13865.1 cell division protein FtsB [Neisseria dentiae]QMT45698.1 cell division protein FtsB [Neisseria dentiae]